jgi:hypothetical protein
MVRHSPGFRPLAYLAKRDYSEPQPCGKALRTVTDFDKILAAQDFVGARIRKAEPVDITAMAWSQTDLDLPVGLFRLTISLGNSKSAVFTFTKDELVENHGTNLWKTYLIGRVNEIVAEIKEQCE